MIGIRLHVRITHHIVFITLNISAIKQCIPVFRIVFIDYSNPVYFFLQQGMAIIQSKSESEGASTSIDSDQRGDTNNIIIVLHIEQNIVNLFCIQNNMNKALLKSIIVENQERIPAMEVFDREVRFEPNANYILTGQRRAGKTFLLYKRILDLLKEGMDVKAFLYINFEDERLLEFSYRDFNALIESYKELYSMQPRIFFDEIQNIQGWEKFVRRLADTGYRVYLTGSNASMLSREMVSTLGGRFLVKETDTLSFSEFLIFNKLEPSMNFEFSEQRFEIKKRFDPWFRYGGFPEIMKFQDKREYLNNIFLKVFLGDIITRFQVRNKFALQLMIKKLAESTTDEVSFNRIKHIIQSTGVKVGTATIIEYINYLEDAFLIRSVVNYEHKISNRETRKKYYFRDHGLLLLFLAEPSSQALETLVFNHLSKLYPDEVSYLRENLEVDFLVPEKLLVQVSYTLKDPSTRQRELKALSTAREKYNTDNILIITMNEEEVLDEGIRVVPVWKWVLEGISGGGNGKG